jgi:hypothetical protein
MAFPAFEAFAALLAIGPNGHDAILPDVDDPTLSEWMKEDVV